MKIFAHPITSMIAIGGFSVAVLLLPVSATAAANSPDRKGSSDLQITRDPASGKVIVSWNGKGALKQSTTLNGRFKPTKTRGGSLTTDAEGEQMLFQVESASGTVFSVNIVGYVNLQLPPGLSLIANPLWTYDDTLGSLFLYQEPPDGAQVLKYVPGAGYEVSTFDAIAKAWTNPEMTLPPGVGFFFQNPSANTVINTVVGEVFQGTLVNHLPAGFSTEGALVPQAGSITTVHTIPGEPGDILRLYVNDLQGGGDYVTSVFNGETGWEPDLTLGVGQGFVSEKQNPQDWIRIFHVN
jgi:hypothetical protein